MSKKIFTKEVEENTEETPVEETTEETQEEVSQEEVNETVEKVFGSKAKEIETTLSAKLDESVSKMKDDLEAFADKVSASVKTSSKPSISIDKEAYGAFKKAVVGGQKADMVIDLKDVDFANVKAAGDISIDDSITGELPQAELDTVVSRDPQRQPFIEELVRVGTIGSNLDAWIETTDEEGNPLPVAELAAIPAKDYDFARKTAEVKKIGVHAKYSAEMAEDLPNLVSEVRNFLVSDLRRVVDTQILTGNGAGENLTGILENATAYSAGDFAGTVAEANHFDVIETAVSQVRTALHTPTHVVVHPTDLSKMNLAKAEDGHYVMPPFIASDGSVVSGVRVIVNTGITAGTFLVGDFTKSSVKYRRGLTLELTNTDQDDFVKDRFTVKATVRLVHRVRENDYESFVTGSFATAKAALEANS